MSFTREADSPSRSTVALPVKTNMLRNLCSTAKVMFCGTSEMFGENVALRLPPGMPPSKTLQNLIGKEGKTVTIFYILEQFYLKEMRIY